MRPAASTVFLSGALTFTVILSTNPQGGLAAESRAILVAQERIIREIQLVSQFDSNRDNRLDDTERRAARAYLDGHPELRPRARRRRNYQPGAPGLKVSPADVRAATGTGLYDSRTLRTLFLAFEDDLWEEELVAFHGTDVDIPATLTVDGKTYPGVGVHFRGHNSFLGVPDGLKRSLTVSIDFVKGSRRLLRYRGLHLMNAYQDPTFIRGVIYLEIARQYIRAPKANFVRVVINGESWGVYPNQQRFDTDFLRDHFGTTKGTRWKSLNNAPGGGLSYLGDDVEAYKAAYEIKSKDDPEAWAALMKLCRIMFETAPDRLIEALDPILDIDATLKLLALDNALMNGDGYWEDGSDFNLYMNPGGRFHLVPYDVNEAFRPMGRRGAELDPFAGSADPNKALLGRLLAVPELRTRYLRYLADIAQKWLDWDTLGPLVARHQEVITAEVLRDTRKLYSTEEFTRGVAGDERDAQPDITTLKGFADQRRAYLLSHPEVIKARGR